MFQKGSSDPSHTCSARLEISLAIIFLLLFFFATKTIQKDYHEQTASLTSSKNPPPKQTIRDKIMTFKNKNTIKFEPHLYSAVIQDRNDIFPNIITNSDVVVDLQLFTSVYRK